MIPRCLALTGLLGLALSAWLFSLSASPAIALPITATYKIVSGSTGPIKGLETGVDDSVDPSLVGGFPNEAPFEHSSWPTPLAIGVTADSFGTTAAKAIKLTLSSSSNVFAQGRVGDSTKYLATLWDHGSLSLYRELAPDSGAADTIGAAVATAFALTGGHRRDLFFPDLHIPQSGIIFSCDGCLGATSSTPRPAGLLLFGAALVGIGSLIRRRTHGPVKPNI